MSYALFSNHVKVSKSFPTKEEVWKHAIRSDLVSEIPSTEEDPPVRSLEQGYTVEECPSDAPDAHDQHGLSEYDIEQIIETARINRPTAGVSS